MAPGRVDTSGQLPELPTAPSALGGLLASVQRVLARVEQVPMGDIARELRSTMDSIRVTLEQMRQLMGTARELDLLPGMARTLDQATATLERAEAALAPDATLRTDMRKLLRELGDAARSLRVLSETLERQPDALLYGKEAP
jgi:paraquat-inducible protein B